MKPALSRQPAEERSFEAVRSQIQPRVTAEHRAKALDAMVERLKKNTPVTVDDAELARIKIVGAPASGPSQEVREPTRLQYPGRPFHQLA